LTFQKAYPAVNGDQYGIISCFCDDENICSWRSDDFLGELVECEMCMSDTTCPISPWLDYEGELVLARNIFVNDQTFNTLQSDLYDNGQPYGMAEVLGRIQNEVLHIF
jgi:hypothetical protein